MAANWGCVEDRDEYGKFIAYHIMPMIQIDGEAIVSDAHDMSKDCHCHPTLEFGKGGWSIWNHNDATHPGSKEMEAEGISDEQRPTTN